MVNFIKNTFSTVPKFVAFVLGGTIAAIQPAVPFLLVCFLAIIVDVFSAFRLSQRVKRLHGRSDGKIKSEHASKIFGTMMMISLIIILCHFIDAEITTGIGVSLANVVSGAFCFVQLLSILENESSENDALWAKALQKFLINKANRHFNIDVEELLHDTDKNVDSDSN